MDKKGHEALAKALDPTIHIFPTPKAPGENFRYVHLSPHPDAAAEITFATRIINLLDSAGLMESSPGRDLTRQLPAFDLKAFSGTTLILEDTNFNHRTK